MITINFEHVDYLESIHPSMSVMVKYSVFAYVENGMVTITYIGGKVCSLLSEGDYETLDIPVMGNNREKNELIALFTQLAVKAAQNEIKRREDEKQRANQTA